MTDRLDRVERIIEALAETSARNAGELAELRGIVENFALQLDVFVQEGRQFRLEFRATQLEIREMQLDIRGLQVENRRILERLEQHTSDDHGA